MTKLRPQSMPLRLLAIVVSTAFLLAACGGGGGEGEGDGGATTTEQAETPREGGELTMGLEAESTGWQPCVNSHAVPGTIVMLSIYDPLMQQDEDGEYHPFLAESLESNDDATEWTLGLRDGVTFHDGTPLDAEAVKANFDAAKQPGSVCLGAAAPIQSVEVVDESTVKFTMTGPFGPFPSLLSSSALGLMFSPANAAARGPDVAANPVGTGPFKFVSWQRDSRLVVEKNEDYWIEGLPYLNQVTFLPIPDEQARLAAVENGDVDLMHSLRQEIVRQARDLGDEFERYEFLGNNSGGSIINVTAPPVDDKRVRQALAYALDQEELIAVLGGAGLSPPATQFFSPDSQWYSEEVAEGWPQNDPERGRQILQGYIDDPNRSDGKAPGEPVTVTFNCPGDPSLIEVAQAYQRQAQRVGIEMELRQFEQSVHIQNAVAGNYMINCWRLGSQADPDTVLFNQYGPVENNPSNVTNFTSPEVQALLKKGRESTDFEERKQAYEDLHLIFNEEVPHLWTGYTATTVVARPEVRNVVDWTFPDGDIRGNGAEQGTVRFRNIWVAE